MRRIYLLLFTGILFAAIANGQSSANYTVSSTTTGSLASDLNANIVDMSTGTTSLVGASNDDLSSSVTTIGFDFWFMGVRYTQFSASSNGLIRLGGTAVSNSNYGITSLGSNSIIAPYGGDLETSSTGKVHYKLVGTAPNRCLVVEFLNMGLDFTGSFLNPDATYQLRLYETNGKIEYVYGSMNVNSSTVNSGALTFNIGFSTGTTTANTFLCINNTSTNAFSTTAFTALAPTRPGSGIAPIIDLNSGANGSRKTYLFTPAIPVDPTTLSFPTVAAGSMTLNWVDNASNEVGFAVYRSTDGTNYTFINQVAAGAGTGTTIISAQTGLVPGTNYFWRVYAVTEGGVSNVLSGSQSTSAALVYTWSGGAGPASWATAGNWTPTRTTPDATDQIIINTSATITNVPTQTISRLTVNTSSTVNLQAAVASTLTIASDGTAADELSIQSGSSLISNGTAAALTITYSGTGSTGTIAGTIEETSATGSTTNNTFNFTGGTSSVTTVTGTLANGQSGGTGVPVITGSAPTLIISGTGTYNHKFTTSAGTIPAATWQTNSICLISGYTTATSISGIAQTFSNLTWNCSAQTSNLSLAGTVPAAINGTFTVTNTNTGSLRLAAATSPTFPVNNFLQTGGTLELNTGAGSSILRVSGTFNQTGGVIQSSANGAGTPTIEFNGSSGIQNVNFFNIAPAGGGTTYRINNTAGINLTGSGTLTTNFNINNGGGIRVSVVAATPITTTLALVYNATGSTLTYDASTGAQTATTTEFPATSGPGNLTINNTTAVPNKIVNIPFNRTIAGTLTITAGDINMGANTLTLGTSTATVGTLTATTNVIIGKFKRWISAATGNRDFPVGIATVPRNAGINYTVAPGTGGTLTAEFITTNPGTTGLPLTEGAINVNTAGKTGYWKIDAADGLTGGTYTGTFTARNFAGVNSFAGLVLIKRPSGGGNWVLDGTHVTTTGSNTVPVLSRTGITTGFSEFGVGGEAVSNPLGFFIVSITTGNWEDASTWNTNTVPASGDNVTIANTHTVTVNATASTGGAVTVNSGGVVTVSGSALTITSTLINNGTVNTSGGTLTITGASTTGITNAATTGIFNVTSGTVNLGPSGGSNRTFSNSGTLSVTGGTLNVNGNLLNASGSTFIQSAGDINIDGNDGTAPGSVAITSDLFAFGTNGTNYSAGTVTVTGGNLTIIDPHFAGTATSSGGAALAFRSSSPARNFGAAHTTTFGGASGTNASTAAFEFFVDCYVNSAELLLGNVVVNGGTATRRVQTNAISGGGGLNVSGDLTINSANELLDLNVAGQGVVVSGNITNNGTFTQTNAAGLLLGTLSGTSNTTFGATTVAQAINGSGTFRNLTASPTANLTNLNINNTNAAGVTLNVPLSVSGTLTLTAGFVNTTTTNLLTLGTAAIAGTLSGGSATAYIKGPFARTFAASRTASGTYSAATLYPVGKGASYLPIHIDPTTNAGGPAVLRGEAFTTNSGTLGSGVTSLSTNRWEALVTSGSPNFTNSFIRLNDAGIASTNKILQSTAAAGAYTGISAASLFTGGAPNTLNTVTSIPTAGYSGYFAYGDLTACSAPADQPTAFATSLLGATSFNGSFTAAASTPNNYLVVRYLSPATEAPPVNFNNYTVGGALGTGTVVSTSSATSFSQTGLTAGTAYVYYIYSFNNVACGGPVYTTASPLIGNVTTCASATGTPGTPTSSAVISSSFTATWTASSTPSVTYELDVATNNTFTSFVSGYNALNVGSVLFYNVNTGLSASTTYYVRVRAVLGLCYSINSGTLTVATTCLNSALPVSEGFNTASTSTFPACWTQQTVVGTSPITFETSSTNPVTVPFEGTRYAFWNSYESSHPAGAETRLVSPPITTTGTPSVDVEFQWYNENSTSYNSGAYLNEGVQVQYSLDGTTWVNAGAFVARYDASLASGTGAWKLKTITLPGAAGNQERIFVGFKFRSEYGDNCSLDAAVVQASPPCSAPANVTVGSITTSTASVSFTSGGTSFIVEYGSPGFIPGTGAIAGAGTIMTGAASPVPLSGLTAAALYDVYVRQVCSGSTYSANSSLKQFQTLCTTANIPYLENFDGVTAPAVPVCITVENVNGGNTWRTVSTDFEVSHPNLMRLDFEEDNVTPANDWFFTRGLNLTGGTSYRLRFQYRNSDGTDFVENLEVKYGAGASAVSMTLGTLFSHIGINSNTWKDTLIDFTPVATGVYYIGFHGFSDANQAFLCVDNVNVILTPSCNPPIDVAVSVITSTTAQVSFSSPGGTSFYIEYGPLGFTPGTGAAAGGGTVIGPVGSLSVTITGLTGETTYDVYVRRDCGGVNGFSPNSLPKSFTTGLINDDAPGAIALTVGAGCTGAIYTNVGATASANEVFPSCSGTIESPVWFKFTAPASGAVRISTDAGSGNTFEDSKVGLFSIPTPGDVTNYSLFTIVACDEDGGASAGSTYMSVVYATGLTPGTVYYIAVDRYSGFTDPGTFCITVDQLNSSMLATANTCGSNYQSPFGDNAYTGWQPLVDENSKLIALVKNPAGGAVEDYEVSQNINGAAVRTDAVSGQKYLDRSFHISNTSATNVQVQFFFLSSELTALQGADAATTLSNLGVTRQTEDVSGCHGDFDATNGIETYLTQTGNGTSADGLVKWIGVTTPGFSNFYLHTSKAPVTLKTFLQGAYAGAGTHKNVSATWAAILNANALNQPYSAAPFNYTGTESVSSGFFTATASPTDKLDWVLLELRDASNVLVKQRAAFILVNGNIVDLDGTSSVSFRGVASGNYYLVIRHRNHLSVRTSVTLSEDGALGSNPAPPLYDLSSAQSQAYQDPAIGSLAPPNNNAAMRALPGGVFGMWGGNVNSNSNVRFGGLNNDLAALVAALGGNQGAVLSIYSPADINMDGLVRFGGLNNDLAALVAVLSGNQAAVYSQHQ